ncbi:ABC transporter ATP-binding protein [Bacillus paramycoides]|uniref:ABC transporter ATP-binding protein n=1 Tax=Bacillus paramycoides TaxID=2026194 RepID=UPI003733C4BA
MITLKNLQKSYGNKKILHGINLEVRAGEILGFIGSNGAGKTTTIKIIVGLLLSDEGNISINGFNIDKLKQYKNSFGYVADEPYLYENLTGEEYITFLAQLWGVEYPKDMVVNLLKQFQLEKAYHSRIKNYSFGMKKKLAIIGALVHKPKCLILDEPLNGLDPNSAFIAKEFFKTYVKEGNTVFFSTHTLDIAEKLCDRVAILKNGVIFDCDTVENLTKNKTQDLESYFMEVTQS